MDDNKNRESRRRIDSWVVLMSATLNMAINVGLLFSYNQLFIVIVETFNATRAETATIFSTTSGFGLITGVFYGLLISRLGARTSSALATCMAVLGLAISFFANSAIFLIFSVGIVASPGLTCMYITSSTVVVQHFQSKAILRAMAVLSGGAAVGGMVYPYLISYFVEKYGLRGTHLLLAGIVMQSIPLTVMWRSYHSGNITPVNLDEFKGIDNLKVFSIDKKESVPCDNLGETVITMTYREDNSSDMLSINKEIVQEVKTHYLNSYKTIIYKSQSNSSKGRCFEYMSLCKNKTFCLFTICVAIIFSVLIMFRSFLVDVFADKGFAQSDGTLAILLFNSFNFVGRFAPGFLLQLFNLSELMPLLLSTLLGISTLSLSSFVTTPWSLQILYCLNGVANGILGFSFNATTQALVSRSEVANAMGIVFTSVGITISVSGPVSGFFRDITGSYTIPFFTATAPLVLAGILLCVAEKWLRQQKRSMDSKPPVHVTYTTKM